MAISKLIILLAHHANIHRPIPQIHSRVVCQLLRHLGRPAKGEKGNVGRSRSAEGDRMLRKWTPSILRIREFPPVRPSAACCCAGGNTVGRGPHVHQQRGGRIPGCADTRLLETGLKYPQLRASFSRKNHTGTAYSAPIYYHLFGRFRERPTNHLLVDDWRGTFKNPKNNATLDIGNTETPKLPTTVGTIDRRNVS